jgi:hypothetical protein
MAPPPPPLCTTYVHATSHYCKTEIMHASGVGPNPLHFTAQLQMRRLSCLDPLAHLVHHHWSGLVRRRSTHRIRSQLPPWRHPSPSYSPGPPASAQQPHGSRHGVQTPPLLPRRPPTTPRECPPRHTPLARPTDCMTSSTTLFG